MDSILQFFHSIFSSDGLHQIVATGGIPVLCLIIFAETGLLIGFFLPGDTLLISAGLLSATGVIKVDFITMDLALIGAAILGNSIGYFIGAKAGKQLFERPHSKFFNRDHLLKTHAFYEKYGGITMILARFIPIVRTFAPVVAGTASMGLKKFMLYNILGAIIWIGTVTSVGYFIARTFPEIEKYLQLAVLGVVGISLLLPLIQWLRTRKK